MLRLLQHLLLLLSLLAAPALLQATTTSPMMLASQWRDGPDVSRYLVSEKLDGVRARWDGSMLWTRSGIRIAAPTWFTHSWPRQAMDGELWMGRSRFEATSAIVRGMPGDEAGWRQLRFMAFDLPAHAGGFAQRHAVLEALLASPGSPYLALVPQQRLADSGSLYRHLRTIMAAGGEGLMLHHQDNRYADGRSEGLFKLKPHHDAEARVVGHVPGKGKHTGLLGALMVESIGTKPVRFRIGSGLSDADRINPPPVGALVTYRYSGLTVHGLPRFPRYLRVRDEPPAATR